MTPFMQTILSQGYGINIGYRPEKPTISLSIYGFFRNAQGYSCKQGEDLDTALALAWKELQTPMPVPATPRASKAEIDSILLELDLDQLDLDL